MVVRKIVQIDEELCNGCGQCIPNCAEGALQIIDGKAKIVKDMYCDGLGACLGHCPQGALTVIERAADPFDEEAVHAYLAGHETHNPEQETLACGCPSSLVQNLEPSTPVPSLGGSDLRQWPVQLNLVPLEAPFFDDADLLVMADCVPVAYPNLHASLLPGRTVVIGCPKFDDAGGYAEKLREILKRNDVRSITIAHMEVPCCSGLNWIVGKAVEASGKDVPVRRHVITVRGEMR
jgi:NAD-dependent dihydropyrimidine dehydrogenase PreA subunit